MRIHLFPSLLLCSWGRGAIELQVAGSLSFYHMETQRVNPTLSNSATDTPRRRPVGAVWRSAVLPELCASGQSQVEHLFEPLRHGGTEKKT